MTALYGAEHGRGLPGSQRYTGLAIGFHWITVASVVAAWLLGLYMVDLPLSPQKLKLYAWHKWLGVTLFALALTRMAWRLRNPPPPLPPSMPAWQRQAAKSSHLLMYGLLLAVPLSGWLFSSASGVPVVYFGVIELWSPLTKDKELAAALKLLHGLLNFVLFAIVCAHSAAALRHHYVERDDVLRRMLPFRADRRKLR
jgi:cytochrome b561